MPLALYALTAGAFGIGVTEFVIMGLLLDMGADLGVSIQAAGLLISGYALGVVVGAPVLTVLTRNWPRKTVLLALMAIFTLGNAACALAPNYGLLMAARVLTAFAHGSFFGVGAVVATGLVAADKRASAIAIMFTGLTVANVLGVPIGTWLGQAPRLARDVLGGGRRGPAGAGHHPGAGAARRRRAREDGLARRPAAMGRRSVLLGLLTTVLGYGGVFAVFTYIAPLLTQITGFDKGAVPPILLVFGGGLVAGNILGGKLADRRLEATVLGSLVALAAVLAGMSFALHGHVAGRRVRRTAGRRGLRHRRAAADVGAVQGRRRRRDARIQLQHRRLQPRQRARRLGGRRGDRPAARACRPSRGRRRCCRWPARRSRSSRCASRAAPAGAPARGPA